MRRPKYTNGSTPHNGYVPTYAPCVVCRLMAVGETRCRTGLGNYCSLACAEAHAERVLKANRHHHPESPHQAPKLRPERVASPAPAPEQLTGQTA